MLVSAEDLAHDIIADIDSIMKEYGEFITIDALAKVINHYQITLERRPEEYLVKEIGKLIKGHL